MTKRRDISSALVTGLAGGVLSISDPFPRVATVGRQHVLISPFGVDPHEPGEPVEVAGGTSAWVIRRDELACRAHDWYRQALAD